MDPVCDTRRAVGRGFGGLCCVSLFSFVRFFGKSCLEYETLFRIYLSESAAWAAAGRGAGAWRQALTRESESEGTRFRESSALCESVVGHDTRPHDGIDWLQWIQ
jgi:hypothetical protein